MGIEVPDFLGAYVRGSQLGRQQVQQNNADIEQQAFRGLVPQVLAGDQNAMAKAAQYDPQTAMALAGYAQKQKAQEQAARDEQMTALRGQAVNVLDGLERIRTQPNYGQIVAQLEADPRINEVAQQLGLSVSELRDPANLPAVRAKLMAPPSKVDGQASPAGAIQEYNKAKETGFTGSYLDFVRQDASARQSSPESFSPVTQADGSVVLVGNRGSIRHTQLTGKNNNVPAGYKQNPDGSLSPIRGGPADAAGGKATDAERVSAGFLGRMQKAEKGLGDFKPSARDFVGFGQIMNGGQTAAIAGNSIMSERGQQYYQNAADWVRAKLRKESGAVIGPQEMEQEIRLYFPLPNDPVSVVRQKAAARKQAEESMKITSGPVAPSSTNAAAHSDGWSIERAD